MQAEEAVRRTADEVSREMGLELWDVEVVGPASCPCLVVYADKEGGITLDDLEALSRALGARSELGRSFTGPWRLDVASPGPERRLRTFEDARRFTGERVQITFKAPVAGRKRLTGRITRATDGTVVIEADGEGEHEILWSDVSLAKLRP